MMILPQRDKADPTVQDRMIIRAIDPDDHADFKALLPNCTPQFVHINDRGSHLVRWCMSKELAEEYGFWGVGCACCGVSSPQDSAVWEFDTDYDETSWYLEGLGS